jgi:DNA-binding MarR family transcriptional regulator
LPSVTPQHDLDRISQAIEHLLRLNASRKVHSQRADAADVSISPPGWVLLRRISADGPCSLGELAEGTAMDPAATGRQIRQLEQQGLVERSTSEDDGRVTLVAATAAGLAAERRIRAVGAQHLGDALASWSDADLQALAVLLSRFVQDLRPVGYREVVGPVGRQEEDDDG